MQICRKSWVLQQQQKTHKIYKIGLGSGRFFKYICLFFYFKSFQLMSLFYWFFLGLAVSHPSNRWPTIRGHTITCMSIRIILAETWVKTPKVSGAPCCVWLDLTSYQVTSYFVKKKKVFTSKDWNESPTLKPSSTVILHTQALLDW